MPPPRFEASRLYGVRLKAHRDELTMTQRDLALLSGIDPATYGKIERGVGNPRLATILKLAATLEVEPSALLDGLTAPELLPSTAKVFSVSDFLRTRRTHTD